ncbi:MAG: hypothetical protein E7Z90_00595 [Cyanobacteria bacterium SIG29]|nr:hypothetical protein [Cyanobacteria bacterium SIG29]
MKKTISLVCLFVFMFSIVPSVQAINIGTYKTETEYGLLDGFKINWKRKDKSEPFIEPREQSSEFEKQREMKYYNEDEYYRTKYMYDGKAIL